MIWDFQTPFFWIGPERGFHPTLQQQTGAVCAPGAGIWAGMRSREAQRAKQGAQLSSWERDGIGQKNSVFAKQSHSSDTPSAPPLLSHTLPSIPRDAPVALCSQKQQRSPVKLWIKQILPMDTEISPPAHHQPEDPTPPCAKSWLYLVWESARHSRNARLAGRSPSRAFPGSRRVPAGGNGSSGTFPAAREEPRSLREAQG